MEALRMEFLAFVLFGTYLSTVLKTVTYIYMTNILLYSCNVICLPC